MTDAVSQTCRAHPDRHDCPDALLEYVPKFDEYGIIIHDGGASLHAISFCPWCGKRLPDSKRDRWFEELERLGLDPDGDGIPEQLLSDSWWSGR